MEHGEITFALCISTAQGALKGRGDLRSQVCLRYCGIHEPICMARGPIKSFITICGCMRNGHGWFRKYDFLLNNDQGSEVSTAHKQSSTLSQMLFPLVDLRYAYPFFPAPNSLELRKQDWLLVQHEQHTKKPVHPQDTWISNPICSFIL